MTLLPFIPAVGGADPSRTDLIGLVEANDCRMTGAEASAILPEDDFTRVETQEITADLLVDGLIRIDRDTDTLILTTEGCR